MRQIALAGFLGVYPGCLPLTVNLARIPYKRGAVIGVFFGSLTHLMTTLLYILASVSIGNAMNDPILANPVTWVCIAVTIFVIQLLSSVGCQMMGAYFLAPHKKSDAFERQKLYERLKVKDLKDNPEDGSKYKRSVLHDVVLLLEQKPAVPDVRFSTAWIFLFGALSLISILIWVHTLNTACLEVLFLGIQADFGWYLDHILCVVVPLIFLILAHFSTLTWLCRDMQSTVTSKKESTIKG